MKFLSVFGTRPEAVKMAPSHAGARSRARTLSFWSASTGQHRELVDPALDFFSIIRPISTSRLMAPEQALNPLVARLIERLDPMLAEAAPDRVIVQGDTTTALAAALAAFHRGIPVAHVEAGLRTYRARRALPRGVQPARDRPDRRPAFRADPRRARQSARRAAGGESLRHRQ